MANKKNTRRRQSMRQRRRHGGAAVPSLDLAAGLDAAYKPLEGSSLQQGQQFQELTKQFHGGAAEYPAALSGTPLIDGSMTAAARTAPLDKALGEIAGMSDQMGGRRGRRSSTRKGRKASRKGRKASRKGRKASRKGQRQSQRQRQRQRQSQRQRQRQRQSQRQRQRQRQRQSGGAATLMNPAEFSKGGDFMMGIDPKWAGLNKEWNDVAAAGGGDYMAPQIQEVYRPDGTHA